MNVITDRERLLTMATYPGMIPAESRLLRQFLRRRGQAFDEFRFGVRIGDGVTLDDSFDAGVRKSWDAITKARPDTVAFAYPAAATIVEVKEAFTTEAVWQLLGYRDLYARTFPTHAIGLVGVAAFAAPNAKTLASRSGVDLFLYDLPPAQVDVLEVAAEVSPDATP